ncbi:hypothetical protein Tco_0971876 [Tanacetum coccineum]
MRDENPIRTLRDYSKPSHEGYRNTIELPVGNNVALLEDLALYDNESWNDPRDFAKPVKEITLPQDVSSTSDCRLIELENQVQRFGPYDTQYCMEDPKQAFVDYASSHNVKMGNRQFTTNLGPRSFKEAINTWKDKPNFNWERTQSFTNPQKGSFSTYSSSNSARLERRLREFDSHQEGRLSNLGAQLGQQQDDMINKINTLWKVFSEKLDDTSTRDTAENPIAQMNFTSTDYHTKEELQSKGIKSPSKLLSLKYLSQSSIIEQNKNPSSPKRVYFINSIIILNKQNEAEEEGGVEPYKMEYINRENADGTDEEVESEKEVKEETEGETKEEEEDDPEHLNTFPHYERVKFNKKKAYLDLESPVNIMSRLHYNWIMRNFTYECEFMVLEDTTSVIDHYLGSVVFEKPFMEESGLIYNKEEGTVIFERGKEKIVFKTPHKIDMFKHVDFTDRGTDSIPLFVIKNDDDNYEKTHYLDSLDLGPEYKYDEYVCRGIQSLMAAKARRKNKGEVTKFLIKNEGEFFTVPGDGVGIKPDSVASPGM